MTRRLTEQEKADRARLREEAKQQKRLEKEAEKQRKREAKLKWAVRVVMSNIKVDRQERANVSPFELGGEIITVQKFTSEKKAKEFKKSIMEKKEETLQTLWTEHADQYKRLTFVSADFRVTCKILRHSQPCNK